MKTTSIMTSTSKKDYLKNEDNLKIKMTPNMKATSNIATFNGTRGLLRSSSLTKQNQTFLNKPAKQNLTPRRTSPDFAGPPFSMHILYGLDL